MTRAAAVAQFLRAHGWHNAIQESFAADFSPRRYMRLQQTDGSHAILMDAEADQKTPQFVNAAKLLRSIDLHAPEIYAADAEQGFVLMEDFGKANWGKLLDEGKAPPSSFIDATDILIALHQRCDLARTSDLNLPIFDRHYFTDQVCLYLDAYVPYVRNSQATLRERSDFRAAWLKILEPIDALPRCLVLRDFMPDNLMIIPDQEGLNKWGLLDFQDAGIGSIAYDLASLCEVVRRDGGHDRFDSVIISYHTKTQPDLSLSNLKEAAIILSAQRHMRILGILVRQMQQGRSEKKPYIARVEKQLRRLFAHHALASLKDQITCYADALSN